MESPPIRCSVEGAGVGGEPDFKYDTNEGYWDGQKLLEQIERKAIPIAEALHPGYQFLFHFDKVTKEHLLFEETRLNTLRPGKLPCKPLVA